MVGKGSIKVEAFFYAIIFVIIVLPLIGIYSFFNQPKVGGGSRSTNMAVSMLVGAILIISIYSIITMRRKRNIEKI